MDVLHHIIFIVGRKCPPLSIHPSIRLSVRTTGRIEFSHFLRNSNISFPHIAWVSFAHHIIAIMITDHEAMVYTTVQVRILFFYSIHTFFLMYHDLYSLQYSLFFVFLCVCVFFFLFFFFLLLLLLLLFCLFFFLFCVVVFLLLLLFFFFFCFFYSNRCFAIRSVIFFTQETWILNCLKRIKVSFL